MKRISDFIAACSILLMLLSACAPQAELVKTRSELSDLREDLKTSTVRVQELQKNLDKNIPKRLDAIEANIKGTVDIQKSIADFGARTDQLSTDIQMLQGRLEENNFRIADLGQKLDDRSFKIAELSARIDELEERLKAAAAGQGIKSEPSGTAEKKAHKPLEPSQAYRQSLNDYNAGNYDIALAGFQNYLAQFPDTSQADKAQYWIGECYYAKKEFRKAVDAFTKVIKAYPKSEKVAGAKLKIAYSYLSENNTAKAREWLNRVSKEYPGTKEAELAKEKLRKMVK